MGAAERAALVREGGRATVPGRAFSPALALAALVGACAPQPAVTTQADPAADFSGYETYEWAAENAVVQAAGSPAEPVSPVVARMIRDAIDAELAERGFAEGEPADFAVSFTVGLRGDEVDAPYRGDFGEYDFGYGRDRYGAGWVAPSYDTTARPFREGTLTIEIVDAETGRPVWSGVAVQEEVTPRYAYPQRVRAIVESVLSEFPPQ